MRKTRLLPAIAAALLLSAGAASAQGMNKDTPERAPAAQQNAPAEKVAPSMKGDRQKPHEQKTPKTTEQTLPDTKSGKVHGTTGQAPSHDADNKASQTKDNKSSVEPGKPGSNDGTNLRSKTEQNVGSPNGTPSKSSQSATEHNRGMTTGQGAAAGSAKLSTEQRTRITSIIRLHKVEPVHLNVSVAVGTRIPASVRLYPLPVEVVDIYPEWRGYDYILIGDEIVIINPRTHEIVAIIEA